ncbi:MAG: hypothetical protein E2O50_01020, partial [Gammaproteobacteria bacterium]
LHAQEIIVSWSPVALLAGKLKIDSVTIAELSIDVLQADGSNAPPDDQLFWLQIPLHIYIESGELARLRIAAAEFENLAITGSIGHGRLQVENMVGQIAGAELQINGELTGPAPGHLVATGSWQLPAANLEGTGSFNGDIEELIVTHVMYMPEEVSFQGSMYGLFTGPTLTGIVEWAAVRLPGAAELYANAGTFKVNSDFRSVDIEGNSSLLLEGWPEAPLQLKAAADIQGISIESYVLDVLGGQVSGVGRIEYGDGLHGQLQISGAQIDTRLMQNKVPGYLDFDSTLLLESVDIFALDVTTANALINGNEFSGRGTVHWRDGELSAVDGFVLAGANRVSADVKLGLQLVGAIDANLPDLALLWPGLQGSMDAVVTLSGSLAKPQISFDSTADSLAYGSQSLDTLVLSGGIQASSKLSGKLVATGLATGQQQLGKLEFSLAGTLAAHQAQLNMTGGIVELELRTTGGWDGEQLTQRFKSGWVRPDGFDVWQLDQSPELKFSAGGGQVDAHCWRQSAASICIDAGTWGAGHFQAVAQVDGFALAALQPLLADGYKIDGTVDANLKLRRDSAGLRGELHWQQSRTVLGYADDIDEFYTELDEVQIDLVSTEEQTDFSATISGEAGLTLVATAKVNGPLLEGSPLVAAANGRMPSIGLLRPLLQRVIHPGELQGKLTIDLDVGGTLGDPVFSGGAVLADGVLGLVGAGITLTDINIAAKSTASDRLQLTGQLRSGEGGAEIKGDIHSEVNAEGIPGLVADIRIKGENLASVRIPDLAVDTSPDLRLKIASGVFDISGAINIPSARAQIHDLPRSAIARSDDVIVHIPEREVEEQGGTIVTGDVVVQLGDDVQFNGFGLDSRLEGSLKLTQNRGGYLRSNGTVRVRDGFLIGYGKELRVDRGTLTFIGPLDDPLINIQVSRESFYEGRQYTVGLRLTGSAQNVKTAPFSRPAMSDNDVLSFLLIDQPTGSGADASGAALALGLGQLFPGDGGMLGLDEVGFETNAANEAAMVAGKRINDKVYVRYVFGSLGEPGAFRIRYRLGRGFSLEASTGARQSLDIIYLLER